AKIRPYDAFPCVMATLPCDCKRIAATALKSALESVLELDGNLGMTECIKRRYATEASAHRKLTELRRRRRSQRAVKVEDHAFHCPHCLAWHLSSDPLDKRLLTR